MIKVTIELISAITGKTSEIGRMYIANDGTGTAERGDYKVAVCKRGGSTEVPRELFDPGDAPPGAPRAMRAGEVKNYPRLAYNVWRLIARAVLAAFPEERPKAPLHRYVPRAPKPAIIDEEVMRGLNLLSHYAPREVGAFPSSMPPIDHSAIYAARAWLAETLADKDGQ